MKIARAIFLQSSRVSDLILTLKFDNFISPMPDVTHIFYGPWDLECNLDALLTEYNINSKQFIINPDHNLFKNTTLPVDIYKFGGWISQQFIKLMVIDQLDYDYILIQDCDTFSIKPYQWLTNTQLFNLYTLFNTSHSDEHYKFVKLFTGHDRQNNHCFVSEFMPTSKKNWNKLKNYIEKKFNTTWIEAIYCAFDKEYAKKSFDQIWFSEYELLGNWNLICDQKHQMIAQKRLELNGSWMKQLNNLKNINCVCNYNSIDFSNINYAEHVIKQQLS